MKTSRTLSEITATCTKAARGAGCPWGMAEEAGLVARRLAAHGLPGAEALADCLAAPRNCACSGAADAPACGLATLAGLLDAPPSDKAELGEVAGPLLLLGFALTDGAYWQVTWPGGSAACGPLGAALYGPLPGPLAAVTLKRISEFSPSLTPDWRARDTDMDAWQSLEALAARTLVPETEASRSRGAGPEG